MRHIQERAAARVLIGCLALLAGCGGGAGQGGGDGGWGSTLPDCATSRQSGLWLLPFGPLSSDINTSGAQKVSVILNRTSAERGKGGAVTGQPVRFRLISLSGDATLSAKTATTDGAGVASAQLLAGRQDGLYQVEASADRTCPVTFSVDVIEPLLQLRILAPKVDPFDTFTHASIPIVAQATRYTQQYGSAGVAGAQVTFSVALGKNAETTLSPAGGGGGGATLKVTTDAAGQATALLSTGAVPVAQLRVVASLAGTADAAVDLRVQSLASGKCTQDGDCPLGYDCKGGVCTAPVTPPATGCTKDGDCPSPLKCELVSGSCVQGTGKACDPMLRTACPADQVCLGNQCVPVPQGCQDNSECPSGFVCENTECVPQGKPSTGGCVTSGDCPTDQVCVNGNCRPSGGCKISHAADRLKATWKFDSKLHLREALSPWLSDLLSAASTLNDIINGSFTISGVPSIISGLVSSALKSVIDTYVPSWGKDLVAALSNINDICSDMRVLSTVKMTSAGTDAYLCNESWDLVEFTYQKTKVSSAPSAIPSIGQVRVPAYTAYETCGTLLLSRHKVSNEVGGIVKWAIDTSLSVITCSSKSTPCYSSVSQALKMSIDCTSLGMSVDMMVMSLWSGAPSVASLVSVACEAEKKDLIDTIDKELAEISTKLSLMEMTGTATIPNPGADNELRNGAWDGVLGSSSVKGNYTGTFTAKRQ